MKRIKLRLNTLEPAVVGLSRGYQIQLNPVLAHFKGPPIFMRQSGITLLQGLGLLFLSSKREQENEPKT